MKAKKGILRGVEFNMSTDSCEHESCAQRTQEKTSGCKWLRHGEVTHCHGYVNNTVQN